MKAPFPFRLAIGKALHLLAFLPIMFWIYPEPVALAFNTQEQVGQSNQALVFQIKSQNQSILSYEQLVQNDPLTIKVHDYLAARNSPLADSAAYIVSQKHWERALAISVVESNMCIHTPKYWAYGAIQESHNCSGMGGDNFKRYTSYNEWFSDLNNLLDQPNYINRPIEKFLGYYVVPGSASWLNGVRKTEADMEELKAEAKEERLAMGYTNSADQVSTTMQIAQVDAN